MRKTRSSTMRHWRIFSPNLAIPGIWLALLSLGILINSWFIRSAEAELNLARQNLNQLAMQTIGREFQRYGLLVNELESITRSPALGKTGTALYLERVLRTWGTAGTIPGLVQRVAVARLINGGQDLLIEQFLDTGVSAWHPQNRIFHLNRVAQIRLAGGAIVLQNLSPAPNDYVLIGPAGNNSLDMAVIAINMQEFYKTWVLPALSLAIPDAKVYWHNRSMKSETEENRPPTPEEPRFNPLATIFGFRISEHFRLEMPMPRFGDFFRGGGNQSPGGPGMGGPGMGRPNGPFMFMPQSDRLFNGEHRDSLSLRFKPGTGLDNIASRLAWNWLAAMALLVGVGVAFTLVVLQIGRLRQTRQREREFVAAVTHELRTPLTVIQSCADNLAGGIIGPERMGDYGRLIQDQSHRLSRMIEDVLDLAGVESHAKAPQLVTIETAAFFEKIQANLESLAHSQHCQLEWDQSDVPQEFTGDPGTLRMILENLVLNAGLHAYPSGQGGPITVKCQLTNPKILAFQVEDQGQGVPVAEQSKVFQAFYRSKASRLNQETGTGLGLYLSRRKARLIGADLSLESPYKPSQGGRQSGCRFSLTISLNGDGKTKP